MADGKPGYIAADAYSVARQRGRMQGGYPPLVFKDTEGNVVLTANKGGIGRHAILIDPQGQQVGAIQKKGISLGSKATYLFFDGQNNQIGQVMLRTGNMGMSESIQLQDPQGGLVATATGNFMGFSFEIYDAQGRKTLAKIYRDTQQKQQQGSGLKGLLTSVASSAIGMMMGAYKIEILEKTINDMSRLFILELIVVLDEMYQPQQGTAFGPGAGGFKI